MRIRKIIFATGIFFATTSFAAAATFADVPAEHENAAAIDYLSKENIISGYPDGSFRPENFVNRAEALKILLLASGAEIQIPTENVFPDVPADAWFAPFVFSAKNSAIVDGYLDGSFRPEQTVNLVEALKILLNTNSVPLENYSTDRQLFADSEKNAWYNPFLFYAKTFALVDADSENKVHPGESLTRGALAEIVFRFRTRVENICPQFLQNTSTIPANYFPGVALDRELPRVFYENEIFSLRGTLANSAAEISAVLESRDDAAQIQFSDELDGSSEFAIAVAVGSPGSFNFSLIPSTTESNTAATIEVLPRECAPATISSSGLPPTAVAPTVIENSPTVEWTDSENNIFRIVIRQNSARVEKLISGGQNSVRLAPADFADFEPGAATLQIFGAHSENGFSFEPRTQWFGSAIVELNLGEHHFATLDTDKISVENLPTFFANQIAFSAVASVDLQNSLFLILPDGAVSEIEISPGASEISAGQNFSVALDLPTRGIYFLEINSTDGIAALNYPLYLPDEFPLLPDFADLREPPNPNRKISFNRERAIWLRLINEFRLSQNLPAVALDPEISEFAQNYAERMVTENFFGHVDPAGRDPDARRIIFGLKMPVGENLARDSTTENAHAGLLRSAAHRQNLLDPSWTRVGLGVAEVDNNLIFVEEFSAEGLTAENLSESKNSLLEQINARRRGLGLDDFSVDGQLDFVAQNWSEKMVAENFIDFKNGGDSLEKNIRAVDPTSAFSTFLVSAGSFSQIAENLSAETLADSAKSRVALGLAQNSVGAIVATLIFR